MDATQVIGIQRYKDASHGHESSATCPSVIAGAVAAASCGNRGCICTGATVSVVTKPKYSVCWDFYHRGFYVDLREPIRHQSRRSACFLWTLRPLHASHRNQYRCWAAIDRWVRFPQRAQRALPKPPEESG